LIEVEQLEQPLGASRMPRCPFHWTNGSCREFVRGRCHLLGCHLTQPTISVSPTMPPKRKDRRQPHSELPFDFIARHVVSALRCVHENGATIARWPAPVLDVPGSAGD
jgi:hypothetical protein